MHSKLFVFCVLLLLFTVCFCSCVKVKAEENVSSASILVAKNRLVTCYEGAKSAESSGANISSLIDTLNNAGLFVSNAEAAYSNRDFSNAERLALTGQNLLNNFETKVYLLRTKGQQAANTDFLINVVGPVIGIVIVVIASVLIWRLPKK